MFSVITTPWKADIWVHLSEESGFPSGSLSQKDSLEKEMATHFHILPWEIPWRATVQGLQRRRIHPSDWTITTNQRKTYKTLDAVKPISKDFQKNSDQTASMKFFDFYSLYKGRKRLDYCRSFYHCDSSGWRKIFGEGANIIVTPPGKYHFSILTVFIKHWEAL